MINVLMIEDDLAESIKEQTAGITQINDSVAQMIKLLKIMLKLLMKC